MPTMIESIKKLQSSLQALSSRENQLSEKYDDDLLKLDDSRSAFDLIDIASMGLWSLQDTAEKNDSITLLKEYPERSLQAAWNIAAILKKVHVESFNSVLGTAQTIAKLTNKGGNGKSHADNLLASLDYLDAQSGNGVPHIIDEVTYNINKAISTFIEEMKSTPQGRNLIGLSSQLGTLSFTNMQQAANERMSAYDEYLKKYPAPPAPILNDREEANTDSEAGNTLSDASDDDDDDESAFHDTLSDIDSSSNDDDDELAYYDASEGLTTDDPQNKIKQLATTFVSEALSNLEARSNDANSDSEQKQYCTKATTTLNNFLSEINNSENLDSIIQYMATSNSQLTEVFAQNRSQTWFKKNISEPFESFKIAINNVLKSFGIAAQLPLSSTQTLKKFNDFKKEYQKIIEVQTAPDNAADQRLENAASSSAKSL